MSRTPFVSIIIVNYNGKHLLSDCLHSLTELDYPKDKYEVIVVDNNSNDDSAAFVHRNFPQFYLVRNQTNQGFVGGNNIGLHYANGEYIVLLNSDTTVDRTWLSEMVRAAYKPNVGIVNSKLYYAVPFLELTLSSSTIEKTDLDGSGNFSPLGVLLEDVICSRQELTDQVWYGNGFYRHLKQQIPCRWMREKATILVPFDQTLGNNNYRFTLHSPTGKKSQGASFSLSLGKTKLLEEELAGKQVRHFHIAISPKQASKHLMWLVQNAGNVVFSDGYGRDRGSLILRDGKETREFYERDSAYFQRPAQLLAFCGASCLIKRKVIDDIGFFDEKYYMYYEDLDLSLRAWLAGWDILYEPKSVVYHRHKASTNTIKGAFMLRHVEKNHLYFLLTYFPLPIFAIEFTLFILRLTMSYMQLIISNFRNNLPLYELMLQKYEARRQALKDMMTNSVYFLRKRHSIKFTRPEAKTRLWQMMY